MYLSHIIVEVFIEIPHTYRWKGISKYTFKSIFQAGKMIYSCDEAIFKPSAITNDSFCISWSVLDQVCQAEKLPGKVCSGSDYGFFHWRLNNRYFRGSKSWGLRILLHCKYDLRIQFFSCINQHCRRPAWEEISYSLITLLPYLKSEPIMYDKHPWAWREVFFQLHYHRNTATPEHQNWLVSSCFVKVINKLNLCLKPLGIVNKTSTVLTAERPYQCPLPEGLLPSTDMLFPRRNSADQQDYFSFL